MTKLRIEVTVEKVVLSLSGVDDVPMYRATFRDVTSNRRIRGVYPSILELLGAVRAYMVKKLDN